MKRVVHAFMIIGLLAGVTACATVPPPGPGLDTQSIDAPPPPPPLDTQPVDAPPPPPPVPEGS